MATIRARIASNKLSLLTHIDSRKALYAGRVIEYTTTFIDHLEIRAIKEVGGHVISSRDLQNWPEHRIAADEGIMALFASNKKWTHVKFGLDCYRVDLTIEEGYGTSNYSVPQTPKMDYIHLLYVAEMIGQDFGVMHGQPWPAITDITYPDALAIITAGGGHELHVKVRTGCLVQWQPLATIAATFPVQSREETERYTTSAGDTIAKLVGIGINAWLRR